MTIKEMHDYAYYKMYKSMTLTTDWGASWRAGAVLLLFEAFIPWSLIMYYELAFSCRVGIGWFIVPAAILYLIDEFTLFSRDQWKGIVKKYDAWPREKNFRGTLIVWGVLLLVIANFGIVIFLYDEVMSQIRGW